MSEPTSYIVEIDEMGNPSIKYADGTPYSVNISDYSAEVLKQLIPRKLNYTVVNQIDGLYIAATKGSEKFQHEKIQGGGSDAAQDENVDLPETD